MARLSSLKCCRGLIVRQLRSHIEYRSSSREFLKSAVCKLWVWMWKSGTYQLSTLSELFNLITFSFISACLVPKDRRYWSRVDLNNDPSGSLIAVSISYLAFVFFLNSDLEELNYFLNFAKPFCSLIDNWPSRTVLFSSAQRPLGKVSDLGRGT